MTSNESRRSSKVAKVAQLSNGERAARMVEALATKAPPKVAAVITKLVPLLGALFNGIDFVTPHVIKAVELINKVRAVVPTEGVLAVIGLMMCLFGGHFPVLIAACEAFYLCGFQQSQESLMQIYVEFQHVKEQDEIDNQKDDDGDGIADVDQIPPSALLIRKLNLFILTVKNPEQLTTACGHIAIALAGVIATLKVQFAKSIALGVTIGDMLREPAVRYFGPLLKIAVPEAYHKWNSVLINMVCKLIAISIAWTVQRIISSVQSALRGGLMFSRNMLILAAKHKFLPNIDLEKTYLDEAIGWGLGAACILWQLRSFYTLSFPFNFILFPVTAAETSLQWYVSP